LLTAYYDLYSDDVVLPTGNLREPRSGANRADVIIVTKCPKDISSSEMKEIAQKLNAKPNQSLFFTTIDYGVEISNDSEKKSVNWLADKKFTLVTGIANPKPLLDYYTSLGLKYEHIDFPDHHNFTKGELKVLDTHEIVVTTEKDYMRLASYLSKQKLFVWLRYNVIKAIIIELV